MIEIRWKIHSHLCREVVSLLVFRGGCCVRIGLQEAYRRIGVEHSYDHQKKAWEAVERNQNVIIAARTGSGKTEAVLLPALAKTLRVVLVYPTKALVQDQVPSVTLLA